LGRANLKITFWGLLGKFAVKSWNLGSGVVRNSPEPFLGRDMAILLTVKARFFPKKVAREIFTMARLKMDSVMVTGQ
jgi:hypothetical protein